MSFEMTVLCCFVGMSKRIRRFIVSRLLIVTQTTTHKHFTIVTPSVLFSSIPLLNISTFFGSLRPSRPVLPSTRKVSSPQTDSQSPLGKGISSRFSERWDCSMLTTFSRSCSAVRQLKLDGGVRNPCPPSCEPPTTVCGSFPF